jgi:SHS2 domain-containing protein
MDFEFFEHEADQGIRGYGDSMDEAFENGAKALFEIMCDSSKVEPRFEIEVSVSADDLEALFVEWLNELLSLKDIEGLMFSKFKVSIRGSGTGTYFLQGTAFGDAIDREKHGLKLEVKAATYAGLDSGEKHGKKFVQCIVDV